MFRGISRIVIGSVAMFVVFILGIVIDTAGGELIAINYARGTDDGPFAPVISLADNIVWLIVPLMLLGITLWMLWGPVREERREEQIRRVRP